MWMWTKGVRLHQRFLRTNQLEVEVGAGEMEKLPVHGEGAKQKEEAKARRTHRWTFGAGFVLDLMKKQQKKRSHERKRRIYVHDSYLPALLKLQTVYNYFL